MQQSDKKPAAKGKKILLYNSIFLVVAAAILFFLWEAPPETTKHLPNDEIHAKFQTMDKKEAEKLCDECHNPDGPAPLPKDHPPKYRCLFCHKRQ